MEPALVLVAELQGADGKLIVGAVVPRKVFTDKAAFDAYVAALTETPA